MQKEVGVSVSCKDGGVIPDSGFPRDGGMANEEERAQSKWARCKHTVHLIQHAFVHGHRPGVIPLKRAFSERFKYVEGSRRSRDGRSGSSGTRSFGRGT